MLRDSLRAKSLAVSLLVHGAAASVFVLVVGGPRLGGSVAPRASFQMAAREEPDELRPSDPEDPPATTLELPEEPLELPEALAFEPTPAPIPDLTPPAEPPAPAPELLDPRRPFDGVPRTTDLRPPQRETAKAATATPPPEALPTEVAPTPSPAPEERPAAEPEAAGPVASAPSPLPGSTPTPDYPESWARRGWHGEVTIELDVAADGTVTAARVVVSSGFARLDELARATLATWRFAPASDGGRAIAGTFRQRIEFRPR